MSGGPVIRLGTTRAVLCIGGLAFKFARSAHGGVVAVLDLGRVLIKHAAMSASGG